MKKQILNLGKSLSKAEQKSINGGGFITKCTEVGAFCDWISGSGYGTGTCQYNSSTNELMCEPN
ncbi:hypothetical protein KCTC32516_01098 [Polaribacter huanghezhanensis]|uniref:hypothetical protein n=1 Tax=Polaribacter huanghezhanensis TaxID=1354726 RepID=UPI0026476D3F|nr:hypothetical protein [Polaribacter huanghezhanensis]WKD85752.1 hypothetical protein KCTC32516_01098 [Polaribacter huanghezhanensis]